MGHSLVAPRSKSEDPNRQWTIEDDQFLLQSIYKGLSPKEVQTKLATNKDSPSTNMVMLRLILLNEALKQSYGVDLAFYHCQHGDQLNFDETIKAVLLGFYGVEDHGKQDEIWHWEMLFHNDTDEMEYSLYDPEGGSESYWDREIKDYWANLVITFRRSWRDAEALRGQSPAKLISNAISLVYKRHDIPDISGQLIDNMCVYIVLRQLEKRMVQIGSRAEFFEELVALFAEETNEDALVLVED